MKTVTLEVIEKEHSKVADLIAQFKKQAITQFVFPETEIQLSHGEHYAGVVIGKDGESSYHLVLLPEDKEGGKWQAAMDWAKSIGGELPTRREQSLLYANLKEEFQESYYWSGVSHASTGDYAWCQYFLTGYQDYYDKDYYYCRARAVRRLVIE
jgi:hypothetical protein